MSSPGHYRQAEAPLVRAKVPRPECVTAHVSEAEQSDNARADRRTLAMMGWRRAESCTGKGQQGQEWRREARSEGT